MHSTRISTTTDFPDLDRGFYSSMCVAYRQTNFGTCLVFKICSFYIVVNVQHISQRPILPRFLRCTQGAMHLKTTSHHRREHALHISKTMSHAGCICNNNLRLFNHCSSWVEILCLLLFVHWNLKSINNFFQKKPRFFPPWVKQPWVKDFKIESAAFPAENFLSQNQPKKNLASRISAEKMCQSEFGHKKFGCGVYHQSTTASVMSCSKSDEVCI